jgi:hypothetical protein
LNYTRKITENSAFALKSKFSSVKLEQSTDDRELAARGVKPEIPSETTLPTKLGKYITNLNILNSKSLRACEGDVLIQGRFGNAIRIGSSLVKVPAENVVNPNIILTAGFWDTPREASAVVDGTATPHALVYENINKDKSSIWMVSNQKVPFVGATALTQAEKKAHALSSEDRTIEYNGAQIFLNSDRVVLNSKLNEIALFSNNEINLSAIKSITLDTENNIHLRSFKEVVIRADTNISLDAATITITSGTDLAFKTRGSYTINGEKIFIGRHNDTSEPMVLGSSLASWLSKLFALIRRPGFILTTTGPASINPAFLVELEALENGLGIGGNTTLAVFNSRTNFTSETNSV